MDKNDSVNDNININDYAGKVSCFDAIKDPVAWKKEIRAEWDGTMW